MIYSSTCPQENANTNACLQSLIIIIIICLCIIYTVIITFPANVTDVQVQDQSSAHAPPAKRVRVVPPNTSSTMSSDYQASVLQNTLLCIYAF